MQPCFFQGCYSAAGDSQAAHGWVHAAMILGSMSGGTHPAPHGSGHRPGPYSCSHAWPVRGTPPSNAAADCGPLHAEGRVTHEHSRLCCSAALAGCSTSQLLQLTAGPSMLQPFVADFRARFIALLTGAFRTFKPALALSILSPQLTFSEAETQSSIKAGLPVAKADGEPFSAYDLKRLQVGSPCCMMLELHAQRLATPGLTQPNPKVRGVGCWLGSQEQ